MTQIHLLHPETGRRTWVDSFVELCQVLGLDPDAPTGMRLWIDDERAIPGGTFVPALNAQKAKQILLTSSGPIELICFDNDLADPLEEEGYDVIKWMEEVWGQEHQNYDRWPQHVVVQSDNAEAPNNILLFDRNVRKHVLPEHLEESDVRLR